MAVSAQHSTSHLEQRPSIEGLCDAADRHHNIRDVALAKDRAAGLVQEGEAEAVEEGNAMEEDVVPGAGGDLGVRDPGEEAEEPLEADERDAGAQARQVLRAAAV